MTTFEFVFALISVIASLSVVRIVDGFVHLVRHHARVRFSVAQAGWMVSALSLAVGNWAGFWGFREKVHWYAADILLLLSFLVVVYGFCVIVSPDPARDEDLDLTALFERERRRYAWAMFVIVALAVALNVWLADTFDAWARDSAISLAGGALAAIAYVAKSRPVQTAVAAALATLSTAFMVLSLTIVAA